MQDVRSQYVREASEVRCIGILVHCCYVIASFLQTVHSSNERRRENTHGHQFRRPLPRQHAIAFSLITEPRQQTTHLPLEVDKEKYIDEGTLAQDEFVRDLHILDGGIGHLIVLPRHLDVRGHPRKSNGLASVGGIAKLQLAAALQGTLRTRLVRREVKRRARTE